MNLGAGFGWRPLKEQIMEVKLIRSVLVGDADVMPTRGGTIVNLEDAKAREFIVLGLAEEVKTKKAPELANKKAAEPENKGRK